MSLLTIFLVLIVVGIILWAVNEYLPLDPKIKKLLNIVTVVIWLLKASGAIAYLSGIKM